MSDNQNPGDGLQNGTPGAAPATPPKGSKYQIRVIRAGLSGNGNYYPDATLRQGAPLFDKARVFVKSDAEHMQTTGKDFRNLIGRLDNPRFIGGDGQDTGEIQATLTLIDPAGEVATRLREAHGRDMTDMFGFSIDAFCSSAQARIDGRTVRVAKSITKVNSVDLVIEPAAGGTILNLIEARGNPMPDDALTPREIRTIINASNLPGAAKERLIEASQDRPDLTEDGIKGEIDKERAYIARFVESGKVVGLGGSARIEMGESEAEKKARMLDALLDPTDASAVSIRECYVDMTGDRNITGQTRNCDQTRLREALGSQSWPEALGDAVGRRMVADYRATGVYDVWRNLVLVVPVSDFRAQDRTRFGGYGDLPTVTEGDPYPSLASPTDESASYSVAKRGGTEELTLEMITNDDVGAVQKIPVKLARAAKRTLGKFVLDHLRTNPAIYDGKTLFHADHGNLGVAAMDGATVAAGRLAMKAQTEKDSGDRLGIGPRYLWVPDALEEAAVDLFRRSTNQDKTFLQSLTLEVMPVWYWTDANDWCLSADPLDIPTIELGFLRGQQEPELFIQDNPSMGSMFSHDKTTYKIRHVYGATVLDYRGLYKAVVP